MFSNMGSDANIDWATLAQQWIQRNMKEHMNEAPPPPNISLYEKRSRNYGFDEKGEADMEMEDDEQPPPPPPMMAINPEDPNVYSMQPMIGSDENSHHIDTAMVWNSWMNPPNPASIQPFHKPNPTAHIPSLMKINVPNPNDATKTEDIACDNSSTTLDAAKRKKLPAWIREGLEKMEREKQKQMEREQQLKVLGNDKPTTSTDVISSTDITVKDHVVRPLESGDSSGNEQDDEEDLLYKAKHANKSKDIGSVEVRAQVSSGASNDEDDDDAGTAPTIFFGKSYEQRLADLMISVRRTLTELLLEVTNDEIAQIAKETLSAHKLKASSAQVVRKSALSSITNRLGLAAYSSSGDESNSDDSEDDSAKNNSRRRSGNKSSVAEDSEEEIKTKLRMRRRTFAKISEDIEERVALNAAREEQKLRYYKEKELKQQRDANGSEDEDKVPANSMPNFSGIGKSNTRDFGETTTESKLHQTNGPKSKDRNSSRRGERTTRFSDNKDKNAAAVTASYMSQLAPSVVAPINAVNSTVHGFQMASNVGSFDVNMYTPTTAAAAAGMNTMLNAAEAALEKAAKVKNSTSTSSSSQFKSRKSNDRRGQESARSGSRREGSKKRRHHSSDDSESSSSTSNNSSSSTTSSSSSRDSKYSRGSSNSMSRHKSRSHNSIRYRERYEDQRRSHHERNRNEHDHAKSHRHTSSKRPAQSRNRSRSRSRSHSTYSSSSSKRRNRHRQ